MLNFGDLTTGEPPEGFERIPPEHRMRYMMLAIEQLGMVQVTLATVTLQAMNAAPQIDQAKLGGVTAGLMRASLYALGYRATTNEKG